MVEGFALSENTALLDWVQPLEISVTSKAVHFATRLESPSRTLSRKHEKQLAQAFAVLLANEDDPDAVGAVAVEEKLNHQGFLLMTATNIGSQKARLASFVQIMDGIRGALKLGQPGIRPQHL
jgi:hypothetical protein